MSGYTPELDSDVPGPRSPSSDPSVTSASASAPRRRGRAHRALPHLATLDVFFHLDWAELSSYTTALRPPIPSWPPLRALTVHAATDLPLVAARVGRCEALKLAIADLRVGCDPPRGSGGLPWFEDRAGPARLAMAAKVGDGGLGGARLWAAVGKSARGLRSLVLTLERRDAGGSRVEERDESTDVTDLPGALATLPGLEHLSLWVAKAQEDGGEVDTDEGDEGLEEIRKL
ncbi:uncharacterized protein BXZ73DRAFT_104543 [Epithele typhae]|uniref:uncharacterized protein n=1 Tax=Epithele typhae TaxID=378194 RepID=UPI002008B988|nr:uncharacterized protein BXZ73DRAFT_104543 [Epithele typhae]KAH9921251.1 hypothetical protein BXZ73DRAFT_104543 [Epithele typhae]